MVTVLLVLTETVQSTNNRNGLWYVIRRLGEVHSCDAFVAGHVYGDVKRKQQRASLMR